MREEFDLSCDSRVLMTETVDEQVYVTQLPNSFFKFNTEEVKNELIATDAYISFMRTNGLEVSREDADAFI